MVPTIIEPIDLTEERSMNRKTTQMIKGIAILIMIAHHFIVFPFVKLPYFITLFGEACKICVAVDAVLSGYGYFFAKEKTIKYGLKKSWGLLQIYWISLFALFIPIAMMGGWKITPWNLFVQMFGLLPNLNWFAWYVFFYIFCMSVMPLLCKCRVFRFNLYINLLLMLIVPYLLEIVIRILPNYETNTIVHDLFSCFLYFPCFLVGYWMAENQIIEKVKKTKYLQNIVICLIGIVSVFMLRILCNSVAGFLLDVFYAPLLICLIDKLLELVNWKPVKYILTLCGKYSTGMWFFHAVFFSTYICDWFQPILKTVTWPPLMFIWLVILSLLGAVICQKILTGMRLCVRAIRSASDV